MKRSQVQKQIKVVRQGLGLSKDSILIPFSAVTKQGRDEIWDLAERDLWLERIRRKRRRIESQEAEIWV